MEGKLISHYRIIGEIGAGGMGVVYRAEDTKLGRTVAIKFISPTGSEDEEERARFLHEAQAAASLSHPNICTVHEIDEAEGRLFLAMELIEGESLKERIARGPLSIAEAIDVAVQTASGLDAAHRKKIVHRDIKPGNVMVEPSGLVKIMDFGLAKMSGRSKLTKTGTTLGTTAYMSPEQARGKEADERSDVWSLGAVIYEMVTGQQPFRGDYEQAVIYSILNDAPEPLTAVRTGVPMELERIVGKALAKEPAERYQHTDELIADLKALKKVLNGGITPQPGAAAPAARRSRKRLASVLIPVCIAAAAVVAFVLLRPILFGGAVATERRPVTVIVFENQTGDPQYDNLKKVIPNLLITSLEQSKYLQVVTWERQRDILKQMGRESIESVDTELGIEMCRREGIGAIVTGSFVQLGGKFVTDIKVLRVKSKDLITSARTEGDGIESIPSQVDRLSREIARGIGLSEPEIDETQRSVIDVTTNSMEAYGWYLKGLDVYAKVYYGEAIQDLSKAIELDSTFAAAYLYLSICHAATFNRPQNHRAIQMALSHSSKATDRERMYIDARAAIVLENDIDKSIAIYERLIKEYPKEKWALYHLGERYRLSGLYDKAIERLTSALELDPAFHLALNDLGYVYLNRADAKRGDYGKALELFRRYSSLIPKDANPYDSMGETYFLMGRLDDAVAMYLRSFELKPELGSATNLAYICGVRGDFPHAIEWIDKNIRITPLPGILISSICWKSMFLMHSGRSAAALADAGRAAAIADSMGNSSMQAIAYAVKGHVMSTFGDNAGARAAFETASRYQLPPYQLEQPTFLATASYFRGMIDMKSGDFEAARKEIGEMEQLLAAISEKAPGGIRTIRNRLAFLGAETMLAEGRPNDAIKYFNKHFSLFAPSGTSASLYSVNSPIDQDALARAFAAKGNLGKAIKEYEKLLAFDPESSDRRIKNPRYEYRLAKLLEKAGKPAEALSHYEKFLEYWKEADPGLPELLDARSRAQALGSARR